MDFNVMDLHDPINDKNLKQCLRVYSVLPKTKEGLSKKDIQAIKVYDSLRKVKAKLWKRFGNQWKQKWAKEIPYSFSSHTISDWVTGRASVPLIAFRALCALGYEKEVNDLLYSVKYVSSTTNVPIAIPLKATPDVLYLSGLLLGDGCFAHAIRKEGNLHYRVALITGNEDFAVNHVKSLFQEIFETNKVTHYFHHRAWTVSKTNKALYRFFTKLIGLPSGKKSIKAHISRVVFESNTKNKVAFFAGLIDSDIGKHGGTIGGTFRSEKFVEDLVSFLDSLGIESKKRGTYIIKEKYPQTDFTIPKSQIKALKYLLDVHYLPKQLERIHAINACMGTKVVKSTRLRGIKF